MNSPRKEISARSTATGWGSRHVLALMGFWSFAMNYAMRFNLSLAIVAMVRHSGPKNESALETCADLHEETLETLAVESGEFSWTEAQQGLILGSFFWGYTVTQLPGGMLSQRFGGKWVVGIGLLITAFATFFIPMAAHAGIGYLVAIRIIQGLAEGLVVPAMQVLLSKWLPPEERSRLATVAYSGVSVGSAVTMVTSGYLIEFFGWPMVFYGIGGFSLVWFICWSLLVFDSPAVHPRISEAEANYIRESLGGYSADDVKMPTPWKKILTAPPVLAIFAAQISNAWGLYTLLTELPTYMRTVLNFDMKQNSWLSASPHVCMWLCGTVVTYLADVMIERKYASVICMRKVCNSIAQWGTGVALLATAFAGCDRVLAVLSLNLSLGMLGTAFGGFLVNSIDIAPNHAGVIMGLGNSFCNLCGFAAPYVAGQLISGDPSLENWRIVFFLAAGFMLVGNTLFVIYASADEQPWNRPLVVDEVQPQLQARQRMRRSSAISEAIQLKVG